MKVKGSHEFKVSREKLWEYLMNPEVLAKITPGVTNLKTLGEDKYQSVSDIKIGPVKGSFKGKLNVENKNHPTSFDIVMEQLSKIGNAHATVHMNLEESDNGNAVLNFDGKAKLSGVIARTGQRVLSGVANALTKEVFASLEKHIEEDIGDSLEEESINTNIETPKDNTTVQNIAEQIKESTNNVVEEVAQNTTETSKGFWAWLKSLFGIK